jgi:signal transduction histidine kinase
MFVARLSNRRLSGPLEEVARATGRQAESGTVEVVPPPTDRVPSEVSQIYAAFNALASRLHATYDELRRNNELLDQRVGERTRELEQARREAVAASESKTAFLSVTSHEIRGPLSVIRGSAELMRLQMDPDDAQQQWVEPILRSARLLQVRLEHLMATVRSGPPLLELVEPGPLVRESTEMFLKGIDPRGCPLEIENQVEDRLPYVRLDAGRFIQVVLALLGNAHEAISATKSQGTIHVRVGCSVLEEREWVTVTLTDDGPGIPDVILGRIFEPFFTTKESGTGFGLYLASEILKEQGGRLTVENAPPLGACFTIWLPAESSLAAATR